MNLSKDLGSKVLAVWLIATGALQLFHVALPYGHTILALVAAGAGVLLLIKR
jgi:pheromone shutdown protein TraB